MKLHTPPNAKQTAGSIQNLNLPDKSLMPAHSEQLEVDTSNAVWYLGIDFGTTGVSAVLLDQLTSQRYPIYWLEEGAKEEDTGNVGEVSASSSSPSCSSDPVFRLPAVIYSGPAVSKLFVDLPGTPIVVGALASKLAKNHLGMVLENFKRFLNITVPYYCPKHHEWEPTLQMPTQQIISLYWVRRALQALLATLAPKQTLSDSVIKVGAVGLQSETLERALGKLEGVVFGTPIGWGDTYRFNVREAVLDAKLVKCSEQIFFLEDAIACILAGLPSDELSDSSTQNFFKGGTLVINAGATATELVLIDLPDDPHDLTYSDFSLCSWLYAGNAIEQDIFCQLLYPQLSEAQRQQLSLSNDLELPLPGQPDPQKRDRLVSLLQRTALGQGLLKASGYLKLILQHKDEFTLNLGALSWTVKRQDLDAKVFSPFIQQFNRQLNALLIKTGLSEQGIFQVVGVGGTAASATLKTWLQRKFPNATLIQNADSPTGSGVATGLASLPLYPQVLNRTQQQYSDYFLLLELLRTFWETSDNSAARCYSLEEIMRQLEHRGLNTGACYERLVRLIDGQLPSGLVPSIEDAIWLSQESKQNSYYSTVASAELFVREENQLYRPNPQQQERLRQYLAIILSRSHQTFKEPLVVQLGTTDG